MHHCRGIPRLNGEVPSSTQGTNNLHSRCRPDLLIHHGHSQSMDHKYLKESHISTLCPALDTSSKQTNKNAMIFTQLYQTFFKKQKTTSSQMSRKSDMWMTWDKGTYSAGYFVSPQLNLLLRVACSPRSHHRAAQGLIQHLAQVPAVKATPSPSPVLPSNSTLNQSCVCT